MTKEELMRAMFEECCKHYHCTKCVFHMRDNNKSITCLGAKTSLVVY